ncbi:MAG TPA: L,D-transpeptidase family protein [Dermatophilaceae bacterium]|nr:L,D-transpeptidase family protein [Dermatophilaceae bacterium]
MPLPEHSRAQQHRSAMTMVAALVLATTIAACQPAGAATPTAGSPATTPSASTSAAAATTTAEPAPTASPAPTVVPAAQAPAPAIILAEGATGDRVRDLQARLKQLKHFTGTVDGSYGATTTAAVTAYQKAFTIPPTGTVDEDLWTLLIATTREPNAEELAGRLLPGPALFAVGSSSPVVRELEARLKLLGRWSGDVDNSYTATTAKAVSGYQAKRGLPQTGEVDQRTKNVIWAATRKPTADELNNVKPAPVAGIDVTKLDPRCQTGRVLCASKANRALYWIIDGVVVRRFDARFGTPEFPSDNGTFSVFMKSRDHHSTIYNNAWMPFALFYNGGEAVHYSPTFARDGWGTPQALRGSHGCTNIRDFNGAAWLFDQVQIGDRVVVY